MSNAALMKNIGHDLHGEFGSTARSSFDSGSYVAATYVTATGITIDREDLPKWYRSGKVVWPIRLDLTSGHIITCDGSITHATASGGTYSALASFTAKTFSNAGTSTSVVTSVCYQGSFNLDGAKRFLRFKLRHKGSSTATGSNVIVGTSTVVFGGAHQTPASST